ERLGDAVHRREVRAPREAPARPGRERPPRPAHGAPDGRRGLRQLLEPVRVRGGVPEVDLGEVDRAAQQRLQPREHPREVMARPTIGILTVSDRASRGDYEDLSGPAIETVLREFIATECDYERRVVADEVAEIVAGIRTFAQRSCALVCTTGGTGPAPRDVTPEAMEQVCEKLLPGFGERMRQASLAAGVPTAILSRQTAGIVGTTLVVNLPGKPA